MQGQVLSKELTALCMLQVYPGVQIDLHEYQVFGDFWNHLAETGPSAWDTHLGAACNHGNDVEKIANDAVTGEFSLATSDCQKYLTGFNIPYKPSQCGGS